MIRNAGERSWRGPFGPLEDITAAALLFARISSLKTGSDMKIEIAKIKENKPKNTVGVGCFVLVARDDDGVGYTITFTVEEPDDPNDPGQSGIL